MGFCLEAGEARHRRLRHRPRRRSTACSASCRRRWASSTAGRRAWRRSSASRRRTAPPWTWAAPRRSACCRPPSWPSRPASATPCSAPSARRRTRRASSRSSSARRGPSPTATSAPSPSWAHIARRQMHEHGIASVDYGHIAVTWRRHAQSNPDAQMRKPMTLEDHQASRLVDEPLRLFDCCLFTDGGGAFIVTSAERARDLRQRPALISGLGQVHSAEMIKPWDNAPRRRTRGGRAGVPDGGLHAARHRRRPALRRLHAARRPRPGALRLRRLGRGGANGGGRGARGSAAGCRATRPAACFRRAICRA